MKINFFSSQEPQRLIELLYLISYLQTELPLHARNFSGFAKI